MKSNFDCTIISSSSPSSFLFDSILNCTSTTEFYGEDVVMRKLITLNLSIWSIFPYSILQPLLCILLHNLLNNSTMQNSWILFQCINQPTSLFMYAALIYKKLNTEENFLFLSTILSCYYTISCAINKISLTLTHKEKQQAKAIWSLNEELKIRFFLSLFLSNEIQQKNL